MVTLKKCCVAQKNQINTIEYAVRLNKWYDVTDFIMH